MTRYRELAAELAARVESGELPPGAELPGVRELARRFDTTVSTAARARGLLAEAGVLTLADRRRARVAPDGALAARAHRGEGRVFRLAGSDDPALDLLVRDLGPAVAIVAAPGSSAGLRAVVAGRADGAAVHLLHRTGVYNAPFARALLRGRRPHLVHLWRREQGLIVAPGGPASVTDLAGLRIALRAPGTGTRVLLDRLLRDAGLDPDGVRGPVLGSHLEVALAVATGTVDAGLGVRSAARDLDLAFHPVARESYDVVLPGAALAAAAPLVTALRAQAVRTAVADLGGYDADRAGEVVDLDGEISAQGN